MSSHPQDVVDSGGSVASGGTSEEKEDTIKQMSEQELQNLLDNVMDHSIPLSEKSSEIQKLHAEASKDDLESSLHDDHGFMNPIHAAAALDFYRFSTNGNNSRRRNNRRISTSSTGSSSSYANSSYLNPTYQYEALNKTHSSLQELSSTSNLSNRPGLNAYNGRKSSSGAATGTSGGSSSVLMSRSSRANSFTHDNNNGSSLLVSTSSASAGTTTTTDDMMAGTSGFRSTSQKNNINAYPADDSQLPLIRSTSSSASGFVNHNQQPTTRGVKGSDVDMMRSESAGCASSSPSSSGVNKTRVPNNISSSSSTSSFHVVSCDHNNHQSTTQSQKSNNNNNHHDINNVKNDTVIDMDHVDVNCDDDDVNKTTTSNNNSASVPHVTSSSSLLSTICSSSQSSSNNNSSLNNHNDTTIAEHSTRDNNTKCSGGVEDMEIEYGPDAVEMQVLPKRAYITTYRSSTGASSSNSNSSNNHQVDSRIAFNELESKHGQNYDSVIDSVAKGDFGDSSDRSIVRQSNNNGGDSTTASSILPTVPSSANSNRVNLTSYQQTPSITGPCYSTSASSSSSAPSKPEGKKKKKPEEPKILAEQIKGHVGNKDVEFLVQFVEGAKPKSSSSSCGPSSSSCPNSISSASNSNSNNGINTSSKVTLTRNSTDSSINVSSNMTSGGGGAGVTGARRKERIPSLPAHQNLNATSSSTPTCGKNNSSEGRKRSNTESDPVSTESEKNSRSSRTPDKNQTRDDLSLSKSSHNNLNNGKKGNSTTANINGDDSGSASSAVVSKSKKNNSSYASAVTKCKSLPSPEPSSSTLATESLSSSLSAVGSSTRGPSKVVMLKNKQVSADDHSIGSSVAGSARIHVMSMMSDDEIDEAGYHSDAGDLGAGGFIPAKNRRRVKKNNSLKSTLTSCVPSSSASASAGSSRLPFNVSNGNNGPFNRPLMTSSSSNSFYTNSNRDNHNFHRHNPKVNHADHNRDAASSSSVSSVSGMVSGSSGHHSGTSCNSTHAVSSLTSAGSSTSSGSVTSLSPSADVIMPKRVIKKNGPLISNSSSRVTASTEQNLPPVIMSLKTTPDSAYAAIKTNVTFGFFDDPVIVEFKQHDGVDHHEDDDDKYIMNNDDNINDPLDINTFNYSEIINYIKKAWENVVRLEPPAKCQA